MAIVTYDENGNVVDFLAERNEEIINSLEFEFGVLLKEKEGDKKGNKRLGNRMMQQINKVLNKQPKMTVQQFSNIDAHDIYYYWNSFYDLMCNYTLYFEIVPNRQAFIKYAGLNSRQYEELGSSMDDEIREAIVFIEDSLKQEGFSGAENGNADVKAVGFRMTAKNDGHSIVSAGEEMVAQAIAVETPMELKKRIERIANGNFGLLNERNAK